MATFETEVTGSGVGEEFAVMVNQIAIGGDHAFETGEAGYRRAWKKFWREHVSQPVEAPLERAHDAVGIAGGQRRLPGEHPVCVKPGKHASEDTKARDGQSWLKTRQTRPTMRSDGDCPGETVRS